MKIDEKKLREKIGLNLQAARKAKRYTQDEVAKGAGLATNYYATLERGESLASVETLYKLVVTLNVAASDVFPESI